MTKDGNDWFWDQDYILLNSLTTEKFTNPTKSLWWFRFGHYGNIGCVVSGLGIQNYISFWLKLNRFKFFFLYYEMAMRNQQFLRHESVSKQKNNSVLCIIKRAFLV